MSQSSTPSTASGPPQTSPAPKTLRSVAGLPDTNGPLGQAALIVIDAQEEYLPSGGLPLVGIDEALDNIGALLDAARQQETTIIHVAHLGSAGALFDPAAGGRIIDSASPSPTELVVSKTLPNSFAGTALAAELNEHGLTHLVLTGFMTHMCVSATARAALDLGFASTVVGDAVASRSLPGPGGGPDVPAEVVHRASLAALADRFSVVVNTETVIG